MFRSFSLLLFLSVIFTASCQQQNVYQSRAEEIFPAVLMKYVALYRIDNLPVSPTFFQGQWNVVIFGHEDCNEQCMNRLKIINDVEGFKKLFVIEGQATHTKMRALAGLFPNVAITMGTTAASFDSFYAQFDLDTVEPSQKQFQVYLVNPSAELVYSVSQQDMTSVNLAKEISLIQ